jgi:protein-S-isoprenylcysteine O-methyltransferase Ste14
MLPPIFPIYIARLVPLNRHATLIWLAGVVLLWATRYTHQLGDRWGRAYYALSAILRPWGVILVAVGWLALYAPENPSGRTTDIGWLPTGNWVDTLCWLAIMAFFGLGLWSVAVLGLRRTFFYRRVDDALVTSGPYGLVRHPQFLSAIGITFFSIGLFDPFYFPFAGFSAYGPLITNWALFTFALWCLSILEDRELAAHFGHQYEQYARQVPRLFPN